MKTLREQQAHDAKNKAIWTFVIGMTLWLTALWLWGLYVLNASPSAI